MQRYSEVKGRRFQGIICIQIEYEQYLIYGRADQRGKSAITFERSTFRKSTNHKPSKYRAYSVTTTLGQHSSALEQLER